MKYLVLHWNFDNFSTFFNGYVKCAKIHENHRESVKNNQVKVADCKYTLLRLNGCENGRLLVICYLLL